MMKALYLFLVILLCFQTVLHGQDEDLKTSKWTIYTSGFDYLPDRLNSANFNIGLDSPLKDNQSLYFNVGFIHSYGASRGWFSINAERNIGVRFKTELKNYLNRRTFFAEPLPRNLPLYPNSGAYYSFKFFSQYNNTTREEGVSERIENGDFPEFIHYRNTYHVHRYAFGLLMNLGYKIVGKSGFTRDYTLGIGTQLVHSFSDNRIKDDTGWPNQQKEGFLVPKIYDHGTALLPYFRLRFKLGWSHFK